MLLAPMPLTTVQAQTLTSATVQRVIDGDTFVLTNGERVRFIGIDAPEIGEPGAATATEFVRSRVEGRTVWLEADGADRDQFGRLRRYIWLQQPTNSNDHAQIRAHMLNAQLLQQGHARPMILGAVRHEQLFRQLHQQANTFIGNRNSLVFHRATCRSLPAPANQLALPSRAAAINQGFRACGVCTP